MDGHEGDHGTPPQREVARPLKNGSIKVMAPPQRRFVWHRPRVTCASVQWQPETEVTRYEWERRQTPAEQAAYFEHLRRVFEARPPKLLDPDLAERMFKQIGTCDNGMPGWDAETYESFREEIDRYEIHSTDPTGEWRFQISCEVWRGLVCDRLGVSCRDYRTLPDWRLLCRLRAWLLDDDREAFVWYPPQSVRYENARFNNLQMISPRLSQPSGIVVSTGLQYSADLRSEGSEIIDRLADVDLDDPEAIRQLVERARGLRAAADEAAGVAQAVAEEDPEG